MEYIYDENKVYGIRISIKNKLKNVYNKFIELYFVDDELVIKDMLSSIFCNLFTVNEYKYEFYIKTYTTSDDTPKEYYLWIEQKKERIDKMFKGDIEMYFMDK